MQTEKTLPSALLQNRDSWHEYAATFFDFPAPTGYLSATYEMVENIKAIVGSASSPEEMTRSLERLIEDRTQFLAFADNYLENREYENHPGRQSLVARYQTRFDS